MSKEKKVIEQRYDGFQLESEIHELLFHVMNLPMVELIPLERKLAIAASLAASLMVEEGLSDEQIKALSQTTAKLVEDLALLWTEDNQ